MFCLMKNLITYVLVIGISSIISAQNTEQKIIIEELKKAEPEIANQKCTTCRFVAKESKT